MASFDEPEVFAVVFQLYQKGLFRQAYDLLTETAAMYPEHRRRIFEWRICLAARIDELILAESLLKEALNEGFYYTEFLLRREDDLKALQRRPDFEKLAERSLQMLAEAQLKAKPILTVIEPKKHVAEKTPMLMVLHGNSGNAKNYQDYWDFLSDKGWLVTIPQSSQVGGNNVYVWNDLAIAERELIAHYAVILKKFPIKRKETIISGFSMGGHTVLIAALKQLFPIKGFLAVAPYIGDLKEFDKVLDSYDCAGLCGYFLLGEKDYLCTPAAIELHEKLNQRGIPCGLEVFPGIAHAFPDDYQSAIERAIQFINQE